MKKTLLSVYCLLLSMVLLTVFVTVSCTQNDNTDASAEASVSSEDIESTETGNSADTSTDKATSEENVIYADKTVYCATNSAMSDVETLKPDGTDKWKQYKDNSGDLFYIRIDTKSIEYLGYEALVNTNRKLNDTYTLADYKQDMQWIIDKDLELFKGFGIDAEIKWYCIELYDSETDKPYATNNEIYDSVYTSNTLPSDVENKIIDNPADNAVGAFGYIYTAYAKGEAIYNYYQTLSDAYRSIRPEFYEYTAKAYRQQNGTEMSDLITDYTFPFNALYASAYNDIPLSEIAESIQNKWNQYAKDGLRPQHACGGEITLLSKDCTVEEMLLNDFFRIIND